MRASDTLSPHRARTRRLLGILAASTLAAGAAAAPASAATEFQCIGPVGANAAADNVIPESDLTFRVAGVADFGDVVVGQKFSYAPQIQYDLKNAYFERLGKTGLLADGENKLGGITFWVAIRATNTLEQRQTLRAVINPSANIRVLWDAASQTASVQRYTNAGAPNGPATPNLAGTTNLNTAVTFWTPTSTAPVAFSVAPPGQLGEVNVQSQWRKANATSSDPQDSVFNNPAVPDVDPLTTARPYGSFYARVRIGNHGTGQGRSSLDCVSGGASLLNNTIAYAERGNVPPADGGDRGRYAIQSAPLAALATATPLAQARELTCLDGLGRYIGREINSYEMKLSTGALAAFTPGQAYTLSGAKLDVTLHEAMMKGLYNNLGVYQALPADGKLDQPFTMWIQLKADNTVEGEQLVKIESRWQTTFVDPDGVAGTGDESYPEAKLQFTVPDTTWTPTGGGPIAFSLGAPGQIPELTLVGRGHSGAEGAVFPMHPYGSLFIRAETGRYGASIDCLEGKVDIVNPAIGFSNLGRRDASLSIPRPVPAGDPPSTSTVPAGSGGRYAITHQPRAPFAIAPAPPVGPVITAIPVAAPIVAAAPAPASAPTPKAPTLKLVGATKGALSAKTRKLKVTVGCPAGAAQCTGTITLKSRSKLRVGKGKAKLQTLAGTRTFTVAPGTTKTYTLRVSKVGAAVLRARTSVAATVRIAPKGAKAVTQRVTLRR